MRVSAIQISAFQEPNEEFLGEILRLLGWVTAPAKIGVQRIPVALTQKNQSRASILAMGIAGGNHQIPTRRRKLGWSWQRVHGLAAGHGLSSLAFRLSRLRKSATRSYIKSIDVRPTDDLPRSEVEANNNHCRECGMAPEPKPSCRNPVSAVFAILRSGRVELA